MIVKSTEEQSETEAAAAACSQIVYKDVTHDHQRHFTADGAKIILLDN